MKPFKIEIEPSEIQDLISRLRNTRWPDEILNSDWEYGTNLAELKELSAYWTDQFDWSQHQDSLNQFDHYKTDHEDQNLHFIYQKGKGTKNLPLMLIHGWPDSFYRFIKLIPILTEPDENGIAFDLIIPSIPGFGFSDKPEESGMGPAKIAPLFTRLMTETLGYETYFVHGGDWGASIAAQMAVQHPELVKGLHLTNVPPEMFLTADFTEFNKEETACLQNFDLWRRKEGAYVAIQSTKPQTLAYGLNDSPSGLAGWMIEKFRSWSDHKGESFSRDELLISISLYWFTRTAGSAARIYYEAIHQAPPERTKIDVPTYFAIFPADPIQIPESFGRRRFNLKRWSEMSTGGHFAALETPELLAHDIRSAFTVPLS